MLSKFALFVFVGELKDENAIAVSELLKMLHSRWEKMRKFSFSVMDILPLNLRCVAIFFFAQRT